MVGEAKPKIVIVYKDDTDKEPYTEWLHNLQDEDGRRATLIRIGRLENGSYGDWKSVGQGVSELRIKTGPGYRVYFGQSGDEIVLLFGGTKSRQNNDITVAQDFWKDHKARIKLKKKKKGRKDNGKTKKK
jgi:putative addiction module killer protein